MNPTHKKILFSMLTFALLGISAWASYDTYTVKKNDNLSTIAKKYNITVKELTTPNALKYSAILQVGQQLKVPAQFAQYTIKKGDTLGAIAQRHTITLNTLKRANPGLEPRKLSIGQKINVPLKDTPLSATPLSVPLLPYTVTRQLERIPINNTRWKYIVIHHSASARGTIKSMDRYHREERRMENGLAYHFVIGNGGGIPDGKLELGSRWKRQLNGGHLASEKLNRKSIGICLVGNFEKAPPSKKQMKTLEATLRYLKQRCGLSTSAIYTHKSINTKPTACPGKHFSLTKIKRSLRQ